MMKITLMAIVSFALSGASAQEWFPLGASWYYTQIIFFEVESYEHFEVIGDTVVQGRQSKVISGYCQCSLFGLKNILHQDGDLVYVFDPVADSFKILYNFYLQPGDTIVYKSNSQDGDAHFLIDSITLFQAGSLTFRVQHIRSLDGFFHFGTKIYERIGSNGCLFPVSSICDPSTGGLRCYEDAQTGLINFQEPERPCNYISDVGDPKDEIKVDVFPNPTSETIYIDSEIPLKNISLYDCIGKKVYESHLRGNQDAEIDVTDLAASLYYLRIITNENKVVLKSIFFN